MAKKRGPGRPPGTSDVNKAKLIRDYWDANPSKTASEVAQELSSAHDMTISPTYVSNVRSTAKKKKRGRKRRKLLAGAAPAAAEAASSQKGAPKFSRKSLLEAKRLAKEMGGIPSAKAALELLSELTD